MVASSSPLSVLSFLSSPARPFCINGTEMVPGLAHDGTHPRLGRFSPPFSSPAEVQSCPCPCPFLKAGHVNQNRSARRYSLKCYHRKDWRQCTSPILLHPDVDLSPSLARVDDDDVRTSLHRILCLSINDPFQVA